MRACACGCGRIWRPLNRRAQFHPECNGEPVTPWTRKWPKKRTVAEQREWKSAQEREAAWIEARWQVVRAERAARMGLR